MIKLEKPIRVTRTGSGWSAIAVIGQVPLPFEENNIVLQLNSIQVYVSGAAKVVISSGRDGTKLYEKTFTAATNDSVVACNLKGDDTHSMVLTVSGAASNVATTIIADISFEYCGGVKAA